LGANILVIHGVVVAVDWLRELLESCLVEDRTKSTIGEVKGYRIPIARRTTSLEDKTASIS
jgi:hypothetical protein